MRRVAAKRFDDLLVWRKAHEFVLNVCKLTLPFPRHEDYGLALQMRRAAVSIPANIAEGFMKRGRPDKARFMNIAQGSIEECRYYPILAQDLGYADTGELINGLAEVGRMLQAYTRSLLSPSS